MVQTYADYEKEYNAHLGEVRKFLASSSNAGTSIESCERALRSAKTCISAMQGMAEVEGDPFKAAEAKRRLEREVSPLEVEIRGRENKQLNGGGGGFGWGSGGGGGGGTDYLFGNRNSYAPPRSAFASDDDFGAAADGEGSMVAPLTETDHRMMDSERLLWETQALCAESEQIGASTLETMGRQGEQLNTASGLIEETLARTEEARQIMKEMAYRMLRNKLFLYCVIALLVLANGGVMIHLWRRKK